MAIKAGVPIIEGVFVSDSIAVIYTVPSNLARSRVDNIVFTNITGSIVTLTVQIIESGGSVDDTNIVVDNIDVSANGSVEPSRLLQGLKTGDTIQAVAGSASAINVRATGTTFT